MVTWQWWGGGEKSLPALSYVPVCLCALCACVPACILRYVAWWLKVLESASIALYTTLRCLPLLPPFLPLLLRCVMGDFYAHLRACHQWLEEKGIDKELASTAVGSYFATFSHASLAAGGSGFQALVEEQTPGGACGVHAWMCTRACTCVCEGMCVCACVRAYVHLPVCLSVCLSVCLCMELYMAA